MTLVLRPPSVWGDGGGGVCVTGRVTVYDKI